MPTHYETATFLHDYARLTPVQRARFNTALRRFISDLRAMEAGERDRFRPGLRVRVVRGQPGTFEMSWDSDGRATFSFGTPINPGSRHVQWHRCGSHNILP
ncbi:MAG: hypothetical protein OXI96_05065 [Acidimicrobiaceae bacterium]|nr:hypothetical protein [Acidimicrobiaceae bacterium]